MKKDYNFNYVFLFYDVGEKRVNKMFKICKKYLTHHQNSVFRGEITPSKIVALKREIGKIIVAEEDIVTIIKFKNRESFVEEKIGNRNIIDVDLDLFL